MLLSWIIGGLGIFYRVWVEKMWDGGGGWKCHCFIRGCFYKPTYTLSSIRLYKQYRSPGGTFSLMVNQNIYVSTNI